MLQQLLSFRVVGRKLQGALHLGTRQIGFFLLEVNASENGAYER